MADKGVGPGIFGPPSADPGADVNSVLPDGTGTITVTPSGGTGDVQVGVTPNTFAPLGDLRAVGIFFPDNYGAGAFGTDSSTAIQSALNAAAAFNGGSGGIVQFNRPLAAQGLIWPSKVTLMGYGPHSDVFSDTDANLPPQGAFLQLFAGANQDLIQTQYFVGLETGTTLSGGGISIGATTIPVTAIAGTAFPQVAIGTAPMQLTIGTDTVTYTGVTLSGSNIVAFTGCSNVLANHAGGVAVTLYANEYYTPTRLRLDDLILDGNKTNNSSGRPLAMFTKSHIFSNFVVQNSASDNVFSDSDHTAGYDHEALWYNFRSTDAVGSAINWQGSHDSQFSNGFASRCTGSNIVTSVFGGNLQFANVHSWGSSGYNWDIQTSNASFVNCVSDGAAGPAGIRLNCSNVTWFGGSIYDSAAGQLLIQIGNGNGASNTSQGNRIHASGSMHLGSMLILYADAANLTGGNNEFDLTGTYSTSSRYTSYGAVLLTNSTQVIATATPTVLSLASATPLTFMPASGTLTLLTSTGAVSNIFSFTNSAGVLTVTQSSGSSITINAGTSLFNTTQYGTNTNFGLDTYQVRSSDGNSGGTFQRGDDINHPTWFIGQRVQFTSGTGFNAVPPSVAGTIASVPPTNATIQTALGNLALGTAFQNTLSYDVRLTVYLSITVNTSGVVKLGVGTTNTPTQATIISGVTTVGFVPVTFKIPAGQFALLSISGTITDSIVGQYLEAA